MKPPLLLTYQPENESGLHDSQAEYEAWLDSLPREPFPEPKHFTPQPDLTLTDPFQPNDRS